MPPITWTISTADIAAMTDDTERGTFLGICSRRFARLLWLHNKYGEAITPEERTALKAAAADVLGDMPNPEDFKP